jgi:hypothetical protein
MVRNRLCQRTAIDFIVNGSSRFVKRIFSKKAEQDVFLKADRVKVKNAQRIARRMAKALDNSVFL